MSSPRNVEAFRLVTAMRMQWPINTSSLRYITMISSISIHILPLDLSIMTCSNFLLSAIMSDTLPQNQQAHCPAPLRREGAMIFPSPGPALEDAMLRLSVLSLLSLRILNCVALVVWTPFLLLDLVNRCL
jgi:hypothetical protein